MKKPLKIKLSFEIPDDDPLKEQILEKFKELMGLLQKKERHNAQT